MSNLFDNDTVLLRSAIISPCGLFRYRLEREFSGFGPVIGYWKGETDESWEHRRRRLREFGARPYPMPFTRDAATVGFQRYVVGAYDKRFTWNEFKAAQYRPERLGVIA